MLEGCICEIMILVFDIFVLFWFFIKLLFLYYFIIGFGVLCDEYVILILLLGFIVVLFGDMEIDIGIIIVKCVFFVFIGLIKFVVM